MTSGRDGACGLGCRVANVFFFSSRRRHTSFDCDWSSDVCSSDLGRVWGLPLFRSTIDLTTVGRKSGKPHTRPVWFVVDDGRILVQAGKGKRDWYENLRSEERRGGEKGRTRWAPDHLKTKEKQM